MQSRSGFWCSLALVFLTWSVVSAPPAFAQVAPGAAVQEFVPDPRAQGLGRAFTAVAEGSWSVWWNPGALAATPGMNLVGVSSSSYPIPNSDDITIRSTAIAAARNGLGYGAHFARLGYGDVTATTDQGFALQEFEPNETAIHLAAGADLVRLVRRRPSVVYFGVGLSAKRIHTLVNYTGTPQHKRKVTGTGYDADLGFLLRANLPLRADGRQWGGLAASLGFTQRNLFDRDIAYGKHGPRESLTRLGRRGAALHLEVGNHPTLGTLGELTLSMDRTAADSAFLDREIRNRGMELGLARLLYLRWGRIEDRGGDVVGTTYGWGVGPDVLLKRKLQSLRIRIDYAKVPRGGGLSRVEQYALSVGLGV